MIVVTSIIIIAVYQWWLSLDFLSPHYPILFLLCQGHQGTNPQPKWLFLLAKAIWLLMRVSFLPTHLTHGSAICQKTIITRGAWETHIIKPPPLLIKEKMHTAGIEDFRWCLSSFKGQTLPQVSPQQQTSCLHVFFLLFFFLKDNCFTEFWCFLSNLNMNQPALLGTEFLIDSFSSFNILNILSESLLAWKLFVEKYISSLRWVLSFTMYKYSLFSCCFQNSLSLTK